MPWAVKWRSENALDGKREYLLGRFFYKHPEVPPCVAGHSTAVFRTREAAREHVREVYGYIKSRPDLRAEPHGWKTPQVVKVEVSVNEI